MAGEVDDDRILGLRLRQKGEEGVPHILNRGLFVEEKLEIFVCDGTACRRLQELGHSLGILVGVLQVGDIAGGVLIARDPDDDGHQLAGCGLGRNGVAGRSLA